MQLYKNKNEKKHKSKQEENNMWVDEFLWSSSALFFKNGGSDIGKIL